MQLHFYKYQGAGNDFIIVKDSDLPNSDTLNQVTIEALCDRRFGIGADGFMILGQQAHEDFTMRYFNADGHESTMCGNGGRCAVAFASHMGWVNNYAQFTAIDGYHEAYLLEANEIKLKMIDVTDYQIEEAGIFLNTGSPHWVQWVKDPDSCNVVGEGRKLRYHKRFGTEGANVNFISHQGNTIAIRTYERGVEDETLACGTGATAAAMAVHLKQSIKFNEYLLKAKGGILQVSFNYTKGKFTNVWLQGPAEYVFEGRFPM